MQPPPLPSVQDPGQRLLDEQRARQRQRELDAPPAQIQAAPGALPTIANLPEGAEVESLPETGPTFRIDEIVFSGETVLTRKQLDTVTQPFIGRRLGRNRIDLLLRRLTEAYVAHGYVTTRVYLGTPQNLASGTLSITVVPGRIQAMMLNGAALRPAPPLPKAGLPDTKGGGLLTDAGTAWAFPESVGDVLRLPDLEQGVDQINRLRRNQAQIQILPGQASGESIIAIDNRYGKRFAYNFGIDNYGSSQTGTLRYRASAEADNVIGLQESLALSYIGTSDSNALVFSAAVPYGFHTFSYTTSVSEYQQAIGDYALLLGRTFSQILGWNYVFSRSARSRFAVDATLTKLRAERDINDIELTPQTLTVLRIGVSGLWHFTSHDAPAALTADAGVSRGVPWLAATHDMPGITRSDAHAQFTKFDWSATLQLPLGRIGPADWTYRGTFTGQYSHDALFGNEQLFLGGTDTVRGFTQSSVSGDSGFYLRNECVLTNAPAWRDGHWEPYLFIDGGKTHLVAQGGWPTLAGAGVGVRAQWKVRSNLLSGEMMAGQALLQPAALGPKASVLLFTLNWAT
ncbi:ShlB/FhaC/HecB family hemolysin secretion/activation protein [Trinickia caryophylli]|nr:ShlB/FhaC/HecB family hemolysin secretion/activation protein [Trinickia caryophylli]PMS14282.1 peptide transporter [Trinickia caryophylli]TRX20213.1 ShlB/FhaC/HecB family hemolysin secretion/activation protein [Trinickia caryophylli]WQE13783.1 ShlB/FhaC/HecB family hemolysin secretion/activation protein [Trinickia caryophylli]